MGQMLAAAIKKAALKKNAKGKNDKGRKSEVVSTNGAWPIAGGMDMKLVVFGSGGVGKSSLTLQFVHNSFPEEYDPTIEDNFRKQVIVDDVVNMLDILDTAGQEEFACMKDQWVRGGDGFLLTYSIVDRQTFDDVQKHIKFILNVKESDVLVGNKTDLESDRKVSKAEASELAAKYGLKFLETSAKDRINVDEAFHALVREVRKYSPPRT